MQVVGIPDQRWGEEVCAVVILKPDTQLDEPAVKDFCKGRIAHFKVPKYVLFVDEGFLPLTPSGKVRKFVLSQLCCELLGKKKLSPFNL